TQRVVIDVSPIAAQQRLMCEEAVFALVYRNAEPVARAYRWLDFKQQFAANGKQASADAAHGARPVFGNLIHLERGIVDHRLNSGDDIFIRIANADSSTYRANSGLREAGGQFANCVRMKNAIGVDGDDYFRLRKLQGVANRACLTAVNFISSNSNTDIGEVALRFEEPFVAVVNRTVILRDYFEFAAWIVASSNALDFLVDGFALVKAGHQHADGWLVSVILLRPGARESKLQDYSHDILHHRDQKAKRQDEPEKNRGHYWLRLASH